VLGDILKSFTLPKSDRLLVGIDGVDDAGVYQLDDDTALVQTVDFFPPIVDDPYIFGQVAAANALSDVYAMGGRPVTALNILCMPAALPPGVVADILRGGADKIAEAGAVVVGGHSVKDNELKFGVAVTGLIHPKKIITNGHACPGDKLVLTKALGTGIISTAIKQNKATTDETAAAEKSMTSLNREAAEEMVASGASAATDITGFGLAGHGFEMATASKVSMRIFFDRLQLLPGTLKHAEGGALTGGAGATKKYLGDRIRFDSNLSKPQQDIIFDPQTSGGLLIAIASEKASALVESLVSRGVVAAIIGEIIPSDTIAIDVL